jgi:carbamoyltransferase
VIILGLNAFGHDAAAVLLVDGEPVFGASEERYDRQRHSAAWPAGALRAALAHAGLRPSDVDAVAFPWTRSMARWHKAWHVLRRWPRSRAYFRDPPDGRLPSRRAYLAAMRGVEARLRAEGLRAPLRRVPHHRAHAAAACLALPAGDGAVLTADGMGEWTTAAAWRARGHALERLRRAVYPHSPGKVYAAVTAWLGFGPESDEGKTMGLAAYGDPASPAAAFTRGLLVPDQAALLRVDESRLGFPWGEARLYGDAFLEVLGPPGHAEGPGRPGDADAARGVQDAVETFARAAAEGLLRETGAPVLGLAGGLFLNCALNGALRRAGVDARPFPVAGDAGAAWGAAAEVHRRLTGRAAAPLGSLALGHDLDPEVPALAAREGLRPGGDLGAQARWLAARVAAGGVVGVARGRAELGPRALGRRSLLASPTTTARRDRVNALKGREAWRPLAPVVRAEDARWFEDLVPSPHMILTFRATPEARARIPGGVHVDGSARVQTVAAGEDDLLRAVLDELEALGEPPVLLNTSFNRRGEPLVNTAEEAWRAYRAMGLDALLLGGHVHPGGVPVSAGGA